MNLRRHLCTTALLLALPLGASAQNANLLLNSFLAPQHPVTHMVIKPWAEKISKVTEGRVFMVFGADGDRDATKRPDMARVAAEGCDVLVVTDHHPRFEDPASIRKTLVESAIAARPNLEIYEVSPPEAAIRKAVSLAEPGDSILWAGPGHQDYRDIRGVWRLRLLLIVP